ncbi:alpha/beta hydrolase [Serratia fonticola]|uniref:Alpha/beta hydrolase n=1 Tax=Serratia fonticola TaxID=47917 RepID=A0AAJ1Y8K5_SERFO|nr:alpha/beta hydrolase [Serratia fonticola]MDQ9125037.1 alpha/beta hydrolase [Serratia fonticola]OKP26789.1 alpha/beta hydrolase [Serratia fonticola]
MSAFRVLFLLAVAVQLPAYAKPLVKSSGTAPGTIQWQPCNSTAFQHWFSDGPPPAGLQCGYVEAPLSGQNAAQTVRLALTRLPAVGPKKGSVVIIADGPGSPGINPQIAEQGPAWRLQKSYDIIGYDPRGVGQSTPKISCQLTASEETPSPDENDIPGAEQQARDMVAACIKQTGADVVQHMGTHEAVNDLDAIRRALGEPALSAVAYSYGTKVAALYAERFPKKTRALVLDGVVNLKDDDFTQRINQERGFQQSFLRFADDCEKNGSCPLTSEPNRAIQLYHRMLHKLHDTPFVTPSGYEISADDVITLTRNLLPRRERWPELATALRKIDAGKADDAVTDLIDESYTPDADDARTVITCADMAKPDADQQLLRRQRQQINTAASFPNYLPLHEYPLETCDFWPYSGHVEPHVPLLSTALPPLLFITQRYDPVTPYRNAREMASSFKSPLITREGDGHTLALTGVDGCVDSAVVDYLLSPKKPRRDKSCR